LERFEEPNFLRSAPKKWKKMAANKNRLGGNGQDILRRWRFLPKLLSLSLSLPPTAEV
jgi:hypothetical protein